MDYDFNSIEQKWQDNWRKSKTYKVDEVADKPKFYVLDMFPYPSGAGLHVGHPLGYIASDIYARYKKHNGFNVLHPMGYDSFGLPAEQYAIQTGQHPAITTANNINRYREQLDKIGFSYDWDREVRTSDPNYYKWTQWIFKQLFNSYYSLTEDKAKPIEELIQMFAESGNEGVYAACDEDTPSFTSEKWLSFSEKEKEDILQKYRLTFLSETWVNWCEGLGTVLANDEVKDGRSERGNFPVEQKLMKQWSMRITAYAERLLTSLDSLDWSDSIKEIQRNWIGKSKGASVSFKVDGFEHSIDVFTTRPDTIFGVTFMVLAPEHDLVNTITSPEQKEEIENYCHLAALKSERDRQADVKTVSGAFTGAYAVHPFTNERIPIWIGDYVLASYGTGAVMAVPCGDQRDWNFASHFGIDIKNIFKDTDISEGANEDKSAVLENSDFLSALSFSEATQKVIDALEEKSVGEGKINFRLRDAIFSRQRYWGEPFPIFYEDGIAKATPTNDCIELPPVDKYLPTEQGEPPLARANKNDWNISHGERMEYNTMPGWAGSSWYFLRYMDPKNEDEFVSKEKADYWGQVDLYIGGAEHAVGHLLYSRFWTKFLYDRGFISFDEPFKKMINQGMILGRSSFVYRINDTNTFVSFDKRKDYKCSRLHVDINFVNNDILDIEAFKNWREEFKDAEFILNDDGQYLCGFEVEKMSKSKYNVQTPDELVEKFGADTLRMYEMFLGPLEQFKPWDTKGINGVHNFLRKFWRLAHDSNNDFKVNSSEPSKDELKALHKCIKKVTEDIERHSFNTVVSTLMIAVNELSDLKSNNKAIISELLILISPYAPHFAEELWQKLGNTESITIAKWPQFDEIHLKEDAFTYPVSFNGKMRFTMDLSAELSKEDIEKAVLAFDKTIQYLEGKSPKRVIIVPKKIVNIVI
ncbi:leucine--tRNA ligase [Flavobacteriales bacterium]|nr:leucine--tRNA ligase [Flavobacteriales bacterium]